MPQSELKLIDHKFLLETCDLDQNSNDSYKQKNIISAHKALKKLYSFKQLQDFLINNPKILKLKNAGFASYISYDKDVEIVLYEEIHKINLDETCKQENFLINRNYQNEIFNKERFIASVNKCKSYIEEGEIYQANISEKITISKNLLSSKDLKTIYRNLKSTNPSPYMTFIDFENYAIISSSPESFLKIKKENEEFTVESSPIKGTAKLNEEDILECSEKEKAEHLMIVDLIRNDIGKISKTSSVKVTELMKKYKFKDLFHLISTIQGKINNEHLLKIKDFEIPNFERIFSYCFPGGSITGTPKKRAMEIIDEIESVSRGIYTGSAGYYKFNEGGEFNILIRTLVYDKLTHELSLHSGAGITSGSDPEKEFKEIQLKAKNILSALNFGLERV